MKHTYSAPELEINAFVVEDILTASITPDKSDDETGGQ